MGAWYAIINQLPFDWAHYEFMGNALFAIILVSPLFSLLGCMVINNQMTFFSDALGHAALTGIAIGTIVGLVDPTWAMLVFAVFLTILITLFRKYSAASTDTIIGLVMSFSVALGIVILSRYGGFNKYSKYLVGDVLSITPSEILRLAIVLGAVIVLWCFLFNKMFLISLNRSFAQSRGINVWLVELIFSLTVAISVTASIQWIGLLVINSLLILPAAASRNITGNVSQYNFLALIISMASGIAGLLISYYCGTATGATIVLVAMCFFIVSFILKIKKR